MGVVGRLDQYASMLATEFDDYSMSENLLLRSEQFDNAYWGKVSSSITQNSIVAPDGLSTADTLIEDTSNGSHALLRNVTKSTSVITYTFSVFAKLKDTRNIQLILSASDASGLATVTVNLSTGVISSGPINGSTFSNTSAKVQSYSNGWYRIALTTTSNTVTLINALIYVINGTSNTYTGDGTSGIYIWGVQLEESPVATDYTPTTTAAISRVLASTTNTNITGLGTYYSSGFYENVGFTTFLSANVFAPYDPVYDEFSGTSFGAGQGRYMRQNTDKSVIVYNEIDEITDFRDIVRSGLVLDLDAGMNSSFNNTGTTWNDLSGNGNNGTLVLGPTYNSANGGSIVFDGSNDYSTSTSVTNSLTTLQKEGSLTYEYWIKPTASIKLGYTESNGGSSFYSPGNATPQGLSGDLAYNYGDGGSIYVGFGFAFGTNGFVAGVHKNGYAPPILVDYQTYNGISHLVVIKNATNCSYYINGVLKKTSLTVAGGATIIGDTMSFIANSAGAFMNVFKGDIYSVKFYNRALTATEITQNYNALRNRFGL